MQRHSVVFIIICGLFLLRSEAKNPQRNIIESFSIVKNTMRVGINQYFKKAYLVEDFFVEYDEDIDLEKLDRSLVVMPFIMNVISIIWISGKNYYIDSMDSQLYESLKKIKEVFKVLYPKTQWKGDLIPHKLVDNSLSFKLDPEENIALLFSGGLDSTVSSYYLSSKKQLLITAWGQWDVPLENKNLWKKRRERIIAYAKDNGHSNAFLKSNYSSFLNWKVLMNISPEINRWRIDAVEGIGWAGLTAPILISKGYTTLYIASSENWDLQYPSIANPYIDDNIRFSDCKLKHHLFNFSRLQKVQWLAGERKRLGKDTLEIKGCKSRVVGNCLKCGRCCQTICAMMLLGEDYSAYGYQISRENAMRNIREQVKKSTFCYEDIYNYSCIVNLMKERLLNGGYVPEDLRWLLSYTFDLSKSRDINNQQKIDWGKLHSMFPEIQAQNLEISRSAEGFSKD